MVTKLVKMAYSIRSGNTCCVGSFHSTPRRKKIPINVLMLLADLMLQIGRDQPAVSDEMVKAKREPIAKSPIRANPIAVATELASLSGIRSGCPQQVSLQIPPKVLTLLGVNRPDRQSYLSLSSADQLYNHAVAEKKIPLVPHQRE